MGLLLPVFHTFKFFSNGEISFNVYPSAMPSNRSLRPIVNTIKIVFYNISRSNREDR